MKIRRHRTSYRATSETDITAFLSLMVILVPFLLITAVFSRMTIIELQESPAKSEPLTGASKPLQVIVRDGSIEVVYPAKQGRFRIAGEPDQGALETLSAIVRDLKKDHPQESRAILLLEPQIRYDTLVQVMDTVRTRQSAGQGTSEYVDLFPDISLGEIPAGTAR